MLWGKREGIRLMRRLVFAGIVAFVFAGMAGAEEGSSAGRWVGQEAFYAERTEPKAFFGPRHFFFFEIPDWPEWLSWARFL